MNTIKDIFTEYPNSWIQCLPKYQQNVINELYSQLGDYNQVATSWLNASMPIPPLPANKSSTRRPSMSNWMMENRLSFTLPVVGRVSSPSSSFNPLPLAVPVITRIVRYPLGSKCSKMTRFPAASAFSIVSLSRTVQLASCTL